MFEAKTAEKKNLNICSNALFAIVLIENPFIFFTNFCTNFPKPKGEKKQKQQQQH